MILLRIWVLSSWNHREGMGMVYMILLYTDLSPTAGQNLWIFRHGGNTDVKNLLFASVCLVYCISLSISNWWMTDGFLINQYLCMIWAKGKFICVEKMTDCHSTKMQLIPLPANPELLGGSETPVTRVQWDHTNCRHWRHFSGIKATHLQTILVLAVSS